MQEHQQKQVVNLYEHRYTIGGNPTMNTPRLRRGGGSFLFVYFIFTCIGIPIYVVYFVCDSASEFGAMGSTSFFGVFLP